MSERGWFPHGAATGEPQACDGASAPPRTRPLARQVAQWRVFVPFYARALGLQGSHPTIACALVEHSSLFDDPWSRAARTTTYALRFMLGTDRDATAAALRKLHRAVRGVGYDGRTYHAWDRDVWTWVHLTSVEALLYAVDVMCGPLPHRELEAFYQDTCRIGAMYGVRWADMPPTIGGLRAYVDHGVATKLCRNPGTDRLRHGVLAGDHFRALPVPPSAAAVIGRLLAEPSHVFVFGAFPDPVRRLWGIRWTPMHQAQYVAMVLALRAVTEPLPDRLRMFPPAYRTLRTRSAA